MQIRSACGVLKGKRALQRGLQCSFVSLDPVYRGVSPDTPTLFWPEEDGKGKTDMKITILGTGNALVTECYNTCYVLTSEEGHLLVDGGGGGTILVRLKQAGIDPNEIHHIFVTHKHIDHVMGIIWMMRVICQNMNAGKYQGDAYIYAHEELTEMLLKLAKMLLNKKEIKRIGERLHLVPVGDGEKRRILGHEYTFFDIGSTKAKQYGYMLDLGEGRRLTCCGDEPYNERERKYAEGSAWLLHEAFCLDAQTDVFHPYEKHHSTVKDASMLAEELGVENLLLYHTEDQNIARRQELYRAEGEQYFHGSLWIPEDLDVIEL